jgi:K(+)-stimulated pyrophosphate-energized sodium pump
MQRCIEQPVRRASNVVNTSLSWIGIAYFAGLVAIVFAIFLARWVFARDEGTPGMQRVGRAIYTGAQAFLRRQYRTIAILAIFAAAIIALILGLLGLASNNLGGVSPVDLAWRAAVAFLIGATCSAASGYIGMFVAVKSNVRVASAARRSLGEALVTGLRGGAVSGFLVVALSLLGVSVLFLIYGGTTNPLVAPTQIVGFGFGASFVALFAQLGGGIYTKAADVGADLVGKVEAGIPEDDPRNPAVIADLVGDNVGDCAGRGADLFESTAAENIGAMILGASVASVIGSKAHGYNDGWIIFPLVVVGLGLIASLIGLLTVRAKSVIEPGQGEGRDISAIAMSRLNFGYYVTAALSAIFVVGASYFLLGGNRWYWFAADGLVGIGMSIVFVFLTQYYTAGQWRPVQEIARACKTGPATTVIAGLAVAFENQAIFVLTICGALGLSYFLGTLAGISDKAHGIISVGGIYGTAVATMGMLMSCAYVLAMDTFGPITDNAGGIVEMSQAPESVRDITDALDGVGNTTKALTKGYGVGSAALAAFLLFSAYLDVLQNNRFVPQGSGTVYDVNLANPPVFIAALIGAMLIFLFSSLAIRAVGSAAQVMIQEVRRQFAADPKIMTGESEPDYARCVSISTAAALRQMVLPGALVVLVPILVGIALGPVPAAALLMVGTMGGIIMALVMNNGGGAWDNAKKFIEAGFLRDDEGKVLGKKSAAHEAGVVGDTVGDPFKDTAGPSLHIVIKLLSTITLVMAPLYILLHRGG